MPRITVLMPTYNVAPWVEEAIQSVLNQTYRDFELLVVDDGSTDDTLDHVRTLHDERIRIAAFPDNVGLAENLNRGLDLIDTELVARMDGDDIAEPDWLETGIKVLDSMPEVGICSFGFQFFGAKTSLVRFPEHNEDSKVQMLFGCTVIVPVFRKSVFNDNHLRYLTETFPAEDYSLWAKAYRVTQVYNVQRTLFHYRTHPTQISTSRREAQIAKSNDVRLQMFEWLSPDFTEEEKQYFIGPFLSPQLTSKQDLKERRVFCDKMIDRNRSVGHFDENSLQQRLRKHITISLYDTIVDHYFKEGYSISRYIRYLVGGWALKTNFHYETRFLLRSLLSKGLSK